MSSKVAPTESVLADITPIALETSTSGRTQASPRPLAPDGCEATPHGNGGSFPRRKRGPSAATYTVRTESRDAVVDGLRVDILESELAASVSLRSAALVLPVAVAVLGSISAAAGDTLDALAAVRLAAGGISLCCAELLVLHYPRLQMYWYRAPLLAALAQWLLAVSGFPFKLSGPGCQVQACRVTPLPRSPRSAGYVYDFSVAPHV